MCQVSQFRVLCSEGHTWRSRIPDHVRTENLVSGPQEALVPVPSQRPGWGRPEPRKSPYTQLCSPSSSPLEEPSDQLHPEVLSVMMQMF